MPRRCYALVRQLSDQISYLSKQLLSATVMPGYYVKLLWGPAYAPVGANWELMLPFGLFAEGLPFILVGTFLLMSTAAQNMWHDEIFTSTEHPALFKLTEPMSWQKVGLLCDVPQVADFLRRAGRLGSPI
jgi:hypothetical protein